MKDGNRWAFWSFCCTVLFVLTQVLIVIAGPYILLLLSFGLACGAIAFGLVGRKRLPRGRLRTSVALNVMVVIVIVTAISGMAVREFGVFGRYKGSVNAPYGHLIKMFGSQQAYYSSHGEYFGTWKEYAEKRWFPEYLVSDSCLFDPGTKYYFFLSATKTGFEIHAVPVEGAEEASHHYTDENGNQKEERAVFYYYIDQTGYIRIEIGKPASKRSPILGKTDGEVFPVSQGEFTPVRSK